jgi:membrane protein DedA with SNARE-associated domain
VLIGGSFTPFPFKVLTIASGATGLDLPIFIVSAILARALRFYGVAGLVYRFGAPIRDFIEKRLVLVFTAAVIAVVGGFVALKYLI